jgi:hypothetical protein
MPETHTTNGELLPRYLFLGAAISGRRVLEIGALSAVGIEGAKLCLDLGAREVTMLGDAEEIRALDALDLPPTLNLWEEDEALPPKARFDLIAVHRPAALTTVAQREAWKGRLSPGGHLVVAATGAFDRGGPSYAELAAPLSRLFPSVQVVLQRPFVGHALVPFGVEGPARIDGRLSRESPPSHYLLICGDVPLAIEGPAVLATPSTPVEGADRKPAAQDLEQLRVQLAKAHAAVREREQWLAELKAELEERDAALATREHEARLALGEAATSRREAEAYRDDRDHARQQLRSRQEDVAAALARSKTAEAERDELREKASRSAPREDGTNTGGEAQAQLAEAQQRLAQTQERARRAEVELDEALASDVRHTRELRELSSKLEEAERRSEALQQEVEAHRDNLAEGERTRAALDAEVARLSEDLRAERAPKAAPEPEQEASAAVETPTDAPTDASSAAEPPQSPPVPDGTADRDAERLRIALRDREERLALLRRELTDKAERISRLLAELHEAKTKGLRLFNR